jgi:hypothetical protein
VPTRKQDFIRKDVMMLSTEPTRGLLICEDPSADAQLKSRLSALSTEHDDLDAVINALLKSGACDDLLLTRLKKRKLQLKDAIASVIASRQPGADASVPVAQAS